MLWNPSNKAPDLSTSAASAPQQRGFTFAQLGPRDGDRVGAEVYHLQTSVFERFLSAGGHRAQQKQLIGDN